MTLAIVLALTVVTTQPAQAQTYTFKVLYSFQGGADGGYPYARLTLGYTKWNTFNGTVYGTTYQGGSSNLGTVFVVDNKGKETVLHNFAGSDGAHPVGSLIQGPGRGLGRSPLTFFGTTGGGGSSGYGTVFKLVNNNVETVLHSFAQSDGATPQAGMAVLTNGNGTLLDFFGTTETGGANGFGNVFQLDTSGVETVLHDFAGAPTDGAYPFYGSLVTKFPRWREAILYSTTEAGGASDAGTVFAVNPKTGAYKILWNFTGGADGGYPYGPVVLDKKGSLWGTTTKGGADGFGTVFEISKKGVETVIYSFSGGTDGATPYGGLAPDGQGNFFGTTLAGGANGDGTVFEISSTGTETVIHSFDCATDGCNPSASLVRTRPEPSFGVPAVLYGTTVQGGTGGYGTVFVLNPN